MLDKEEWVQSDQTLESREGLQTMDGWMDPWIHGYIDGLMNEWVDPWLHGYMVESMDAWIDGHSCCTSTDFITTS